MSDLAFVIHSFALRMASRSTASEGSPLEIASPSLMSRSTSPICHAGREERHWKEGEKDEFTKFYNETVRLGNLIPQDNVSRVRSTQSRTMHGTTNDAI